MSELIPGHGRALQPVGPNITPTSSKAMSVKGVPLGDSGLNPEAVITGVISRGVLPRYHGQVEFVGLHPDADMPARGTKLAAAYDLVTPEAISFAPMERKTIPLGFAMALPDHLHGRIESRSGLALKGLVVLTGVIDADYRGELMVIMQNFSDKKYDFAAGDRVAQLALRPTVEVAFEAVESFSTATERSAGGFGSTGR